MTDFDDELKRRYRALATEEPSAVIDAAILAHSRRRRPWIARYAGPVSIAAVLVLGIGVSLRMQLEQPGVETSVPDTQAPQSSSGGAPTAPAPAPMSKDEARRDAFVPSPPETMLPQKKKADAPRELKERVATPAMEANVARAPAPAPAPEPKLSIAPQSTTSAIVTTPPPPAAAAPPPAPQGRLYADEMRPPARAKQEAENDRAAPRSADAVAGVGARALEKSIVETDPARELERIAKLREAGQHAEADKALLEFRKRFPDFRIPDATWEKVRPR